MLALIVGSCKNTSTEPTPGVFQLLKISMDETTLSSSRLITGIPTEGIFTIEFTTPVDTNTVRNSIRLLQQESEIPIQITYENSNATIVMQPMESLDFITEYIVIISTELQSEEGAAFVGLDFSFETENGVLRLLSADVNGTTLSSSKTTRDIAYNNASIKLKFDNPLNPSTYENYFTIVPQADISFSLSTDQTEVTITNNEDLDYYLFYTVIVSNQLTNESGFEFEGYTATFQTGLNPERKFPTISDDELLTKIQEYTFKYFWDFGHPISGLARERNTSGEIVTTGGSGFGLMAMLVGIERGFITREEGIERLTKTINFLANDADRFHGVWSHWLNGSTGTAISFSAKDDGADLVETAFMAQGLITVREYLDENKTSESGLITTINTLLSEIEWSWFTRGGQDVLFWHWSPNFEWEKNLRISGYNEALIVYFLAASSDTYGIDSDVYHNGWARSGNIRNGNVYYGYELPVGYEYGGPLFFAHYSFLGLNPNGLSDTYANYWTQNKNHTLINREYSIANPRKYVGYSAESWGLTASDEPGGYSAHEPNRDNGTITPTAAISSIPYTPEESMQAIRHFYYVLGDKLWGDYGFYDAFNPTENWWADSYLAIDQGPIIIMIENYRTGLLWDLFMAAPEVNTALNTLGFTLDN